MVARLRRVRVPQGPRRRVRAARLPVDVAASPLPRGVPVRAAERAADGFLPARQPDPRGAAPAPDDPPARRQPQRGRVHRHRHRSDPGRPLLHQGRHTPATSNGSIAARPAGRRSRAWSTSPRPPASAPPRCNASRGPAPATSSPAADRHARRTALWQLGVATPAHTTDTGRTARARAGAPRRARAPGARRVGGDDRRLHHHRRLDRPPPRRAATPLTRRAGRDTDRRRSPTSLTAPSRRRRARDRTPATTDRERHRRSCCSRTRTGRST